ncbi:MAG: hypothetical protein ACI93P_000811 [bacterium]|jgi:hypothetical protein
MFTEYNLSNMRFYNYILQKHYFYGYFFANYVKYFLEK